MGGLGTDLSFLAESSSVVNTVGLDALKITSWLEISDLPGRALKPTLIFTENVAKVSQDLRHGLNHQTPVSLQRDKCSGGSSTLHALVITRPTSIYRKLAPPQSTQEESYLFVFNLESSLLNVLGETSL